MKPDRLKQMVQEAWDQSVTEERLKELLSTMKQRCLDVIEAGGGSTKW